MAKNTTVWGIDIGNSSLKAIRCREAAEPGKIEALAFDYIEHSKILSQPGADPAEIMAETLTTFLSRNSTKGDRVAISVAGQNTISRFLRLPPVDPRKVPDILKYEAKQWLPFALEDVIWDFQPIGANEGTDGLLDSEIGMFAMKKDVAMRSLNPYLTAGIDIDCIQSSPLAIYNYVTYDQLRTVANNYELDPENPPDYVVVLCIGTDASDVVITNGYSIWVRSIVIGGNSFTKALTKGLKLTFSKAEYLKRNAAAAQDPKAVFQAMRPVFNEMLTEVHRSIEFYQSLNRKAKFSKVLALGNAMKMPGLRQFLAQNLGYEVIRVANFNRLLGDEVINAPMFKENLVSFGVSLGLAVQALDEAPLGTNLIPKEVVTERIIREKKPWALAACAIIMLGLTFWFTGASRALETVKRGAYAPAESAAKQAVQHGSEMKSGTVAAVGEFGKVKTIGDNLTVSVEGRIAWNELLKALNVILPVEHEQLDREQGRVAIEKQERLFILNIDAINVPDLATWFEPLKTYGLYLPDREEVAEWLAEGVVPAGVEPPAATGGGEEGAETPKLTPEMLTEEQRIAMVPGPPAGTKGKVVQLVGYHYHNGAVDTLFGGQYVVERLLRPLKGYTPDGERIKLKFPAGMHKRMEAADATEEVTMKELGISYPTLVYTPKAIETETLDPRAVLRLYIESEQERMQHMRRGMGASAGGINPMGGSEMDINPFTADANTILNGSSRSGSSQGLDLRKLRPEDKITLRKFDFVVQFAWVETLPSVREKARQDAAEAARLAREEAGTATEEPTPAGNDPVPVAPAADGEETGEETPEGDEPPLPSSDAEPAEPSEDVAPEGPAEPGETEEGTS
ncbi:MAG TPA: hypothetical protein DEB39_14100, partial [Planctomycetaceae bacterium]|nr:hypothetical protein [Planctomycetaceae bacterium]